MKFKFLFFAFLVAGLGSFVTANSAAFVSEDACAVVADGSLTTVDAEVFCLEALDEAEICYTVTVQASIPVVGGIGIGVEVTGCAETAIEAKAKLIEGVVGILTN